MPPHTYHPQYYQTESANIMNKEVKAVRHEGGGK